jgi:hypothetical protein
MWWRLCLVGIAAGCYSGHAAPGAPCTPSLDNCPTNQTCALVSGEYVCVEGAVPDAALADSPEMTIDASPVIDAGIDAAPAVPWSLVQTKATTSGTLNVTATGSGHLLVVAIEGTQAGNVTAVADNAGNTYTAIPNNRAVASAFSVGLELWYAVNSKPGATAVTITAPTVYSAVVWEVANIRTTAPLDTATKLDDQAASTMPLGASITTTQARDFVISVVIVDNVVSGLHTGSAFTNDHTTFGNGWAHLTSNSAPAGTYQAAWDQGTAGAYCAVSAAFFVSP